MMKKACLLLGLMGALSSTSQADALKPRIVVLTDNDQADYIIICYVDCGDSNPESFEVSVASDKVGGGQ